MKRGIILCLIASILLLVGTAIADTRCEFDAVGCDASNFFNGPVENAVIANGVGGGGNLINFYSDFIDPDPDMVPDSNPGWGEKWATD